MSDDEVEYDEQIETLEDDDEDNELVKEAQADDLGDTEPQEEIELQEKIIDGEVDEEELLDNLASDDVIIDTEERVVKMIETKKINIVMGDKRKTSNLLTRFELAKILATRVIDIEKGEPIFIETELADLTEIAKEEIRQKKCPLIILRPVGKDTYELFKVSEFDYR